MKTIRRIKEKIHNLLLTPLYRGVFNGLVTLLLVVCVYLVFNNNYYKEYIQEKRESEHSEEINHIMTEMQNQLRLSGTPLMTIIDNQSMESILNGHEEGKEVISHTLLSMIKNMDNVDQIRILNLEGDELIRVERSESNQCVIVADEDLQNKADRYYFKESLETLNGEVYISPMDLNVEYGEIESPNKPMLRIGKPIKSSSGEVIGAMIINVLGQNIINEISKNQVHDKDQIFLLNSDGYYLYGGGDLDFSFMYKDTESQGFFNDFDMVWQGIKNKETSYYFHKDQFYMKEMSPVNSQGFLNEKIKWYLVVQIFEEDIMENEKFVNNTLALIVFIIGPILIIGNFFLGYSLARSKAYKEELVKNASFDELTGLHNRRMMMNMLEKMVLLAKRSKIPLSIIYIDVNNLKKVNDTIGHQMGDQMIIGAASSIKNSIRSNDFVARLGGDEFLVALPNCLEENVSEIIHKIEVEFEKKGMELMESKWEMSYGYAMLKENESLKKFIERADRYMYENKRMRKDS